MFRKLAILLVVFSALLSCELATHEMEGLWNIATVRSTGTVLGSGSFTLSYWQEISIGGTLWVYYRGTGTIGIVAYDFYLSHRTTGIDNFDLSIYTAGDDYTTSLNWMDFEGTYTTGSPVNGPYHGHGTFAANTGTFIATR